MEDGEFSLLVGLVTSAPFEVELDSSGNSIGAPFSKAMSSRFEYETERSINGRLPFTATIDGNEAELTIIIQDDDVKVDFNVCSVKDVVLPILEKLGAFSMSPTSVLGQQSFSGMDLFSGSISSFDDMLPDVGGLLTGVLEAKNELDHLCAEVEETGAPPPTVEDAMAMIFEEVMESVMESACSGAPSPLVDTTRRSRRLRALHEAQSSPYKRRKLARRAHHLPYNRYTRPRRLMQEKRHLQEGPTVCNALLDSLTIDGGYDGTMFFVRLELDVSKQFGDLEGFLTKPLEDMLGEVDFLKDLFPSSTNSDQAGGVQFSLDISALASARASVLFGFEKAEDESFVDILSFGSSEIASRSFIQLEDLSAKFLLSSSVSASVSLPGVADIGVENGTASIGFGLGLDQKSERMYFTNIESVPLAIGQASWNKSECYFRGCDMYFPTNYTRCHFSTSFVFM